MEVMRIGPADPRHPPLNLNGEGYFLSEWLRPRAAWLAQGIIAGEFDPHRCRLRLAEEAELLARRAGFEKRASAYIVTNEILDRAIWDLEEEAERVLKDIEQQVARMVRIRVPRNEVLAAAHDINGRAGFLIPEPVVTAHSVRTAQAVLQQSNSRHG